MLENFILYVDFDSTLYDTRLFADDLCRDIASLADVTVEQVRTDSKRFFADATLGGYDYIGHIRSYGLDPEIMWDRLDTIVRSKDFLYADSPKFIQELRSKGYNPAILSFGESRFQTTKIVPTLTRLTGSADSKPLGFTVVFHKKGEHIADLHRGQRGALVDDVPDQNLPKGFTEIHLDRKRNLAKPEKTPSGYVVSNLEQALRAILTLH